MLRSIAVAVLVALTVLAGAPIYAIAPSAQAANGLKAIVIVGPSGDSTSFFLEIGAKLADQAEAAGMEVARVFHPRATTERVLANIQGANLVVYLGHGNGWPSPYAPFQERTKNGFGLNEFEGASPMKHIYRGANWIRNNVTLAPNAVTILVGACYASGNGEPGMPIPSQDVAKQRVDNFASGFLAVGAGAVFAFGWIQRANIPALLVNSNHTMDEIFMLRSNGGPSGWVGWNDKYLPSERTPGARVHLDPHASYGYYRGLTGDMSMTAAQFRGAAGDSAAAPGTPLPDTSAPSVPNDLTAVNENGLKVGLNWQPSTDDSGAVKYRVFRNGSRIKGGLTDASYVDTVATPGTYSYQVAALDYSGNVSARSAPVTVEVGDAETASSTRPTTPTGLEAVSLGSRRIGLSWNASASSRSVTYRIFRDGTRIATTSALEFIDRPDRVGSYEYRVRAVDSAGNRSPLSAAVIGRAVRTVD